MGGGPRRLRGPSYSLLPSSWSWGGEGWCGMQDGVSCFCVRPIGREQAEMWAREDANVVWVHRSRRPSVGRTDDAQWEGRCVSQGCPPAAGAASLCAPDPARPSPSQVLNEECVMCFFLVLRLTLDSGRTQPGRSDRGASLRGSAPQHSDARRLLGDTAPSPTGHAHTGARHASSCSRWLCPFILR